jgi:hypothetical protein
MGIYNFEGNSSTVKTINNNAISISGTNTGVSNGMFLSNGIITASSNTINVATASTSIAGIDFTINGIINQGFVDGNSISVSSTAPGVVERGINTSLTNANIINGFSITNNFINSIAASATSGTPALFGIRTSVGTNNVISGNTIKNFTTGTGSGDALISGIDLSGTTTNPTAFGNKIYDLKTSCTGPNSLVNGINVIAGTTTFTLYNNFISDLRAPLSTSINAINGIFCNATNSTYKIYYNTIKLGTSTPLSGGAAFGVKGVSMVDNTGTAILDLRNNIINLNVSPSGNGFGTCVAFSSGTAGVAPVGFATTSNNNIYHINSNTNNYLFAQGIDTSTLVNGFAVSGLTDNFPNNIKNDVNFNTPCGLYKTFVGGTLDLAAYTENNLGAGSSIATFVPSGISFAENGAQAIASPNITTDFNSINRTPTNDIGALQFAGTTATVTLLTASVSTSASPSGAICAGTSLTFTATPTNGGVSPTYQWQINGNNVSGETASTFTTTSLANNDVVTVVMTASNEICVLGSPATSTGITVTVNPNLTPSVSIVASPSGAICS